jgi:hypothetical protein
MTYSDAFNIRTTSVKFNDVADAIDGSITRTFAGTTTGTSNAYIASPTPAWTSYDPSAYISIIPNFTNTGACTVNVSSLGAKSIKRSGVDVSAGALTSGVPTILIYTGVHFEILVIENAVRPDGSIPMTGNLNLGSNKVVSLGNGTARADAITVGQVQDSTPLWGGTTGGTATAYTITLSPAITAYAAGQRFMFIANAANTSGGPTLNVNGVGARNMFLKSTGAALPIGYIRNGELYEAVYDGTQFRITSSSAELQSGLLTYIGQSSGTANAITLTPSPAITNSSYTGLFGLYTFAKDASTNTDACTINVSGLGAINLLDREGVALKAGMLQDSRLYNVYFNGNLAYLLNPSSVWISYTPTLTQSANVTFTTNESKYKLIDNNTVVYAFHLTCTSAGTAANTITLTLPLNASWSRTYSSIGDAVILKTIGASIYTCSVALNTASPGKIAFFSGSGTNANYVGINPAITLASDDEISGTVTYRV